MTTDTTTGQGEDCCIEQCHDLEELREQVAALETRIALLTDANRNANAIIGDQSDELNAIIAEATQRAERAETAIRQCPAKRTPCYQALALAPQPEEPAP